MFKLSVGNTKQKCLRQFCTEVIYNTVGRDDPETDNYNISRYIQ